MVDYSLIHRYKARADDHVKLNINYLDLLKHSEDKGFLFNQLWRYYKRVYRSQYEQLDLNKILVSKEIKLLIEGSSVLDSIKPYFTNNTQTTLINYYNLQDYWGTKVSKLPNFKGRRNGFYINNKDVSREKQAPLIFETKEESKSIRNDKVLTKHWIYMVDPVGLYNIKPHTYYENYMGFRYLLEDFDKVIPNVKQIDYVRLISGEDLYATYRILQDLLWYLKQNPEEATLFDSSDMTDNGSTFFLALQNYFYYGLEKDSAQETAFLKFDLPVIQRFLYYTTLRKKSTGGILTVFKQDSQVATKYQTKKGIDAGIQYMASNSKFLDWGFSYVEYDNDIDQTKIQQVNNEFDAFMQTSLVPSILDKGIQENKFIIRFRKLGREKAEGLYADALKTIIIDNSKSIMHEYGHLIDYNYGKENEMYSMNSEFSGILSRYSELMTQRTRDKNEVLVSRMLDYYLLPTEVFARCFEYYLNYEGFRGYILGHSFDERVQDLENQDYFQEEAYSVCLDEKLSSRIIKYFEDMFGVVTPEQLQKYNQIVEDSSVMETPDLTEQLGTVQLDYSSMTHMQRHICIKAKRYIKAISIDKTRKIIEETDKLYDREDIDFPNDFRLVFKYDKDLDKIVDIAVVTSTKYYNEYKLEGYKIIHTKSMVQTEKSFYELFYSLGIKQFEPIDQLVLDIQAKLQDS